MKTVIREKPSKPKASSRKTTKPKTPKRPKKPAASPVPASERRRSGRAHKVSIYTERDDEEDEQEMLEGVAEWDYGDDDSDGANSGDEDSVLSDAPSDGQEASDAEEADDEPSRGNDDAEASAEEAEEEDEPGPPKSSKRSKAAVIKGKTTAAKPAVKSSVLAQLQRPARSTRVRRGARDASDMDVDTDE